MTKGFIITTAIVWSVIFLAFWLGSGCVSIKMWEKELRYMLTIVLLFSFLPILMSLDQRNK